MSDTRKDMVGRFGPPTNVRKGGYHSGRKRQLTRSQGKRELRREIAEYAS